MDTKEEVFRLLEEDVLLHDALSRHEVVNARGLARWLMENKGIQGTEDNIASAIRDFDPGASHGLLQRAKSALEGAVAIRRDGRCALVVETNGTTLQQLSRLLGRMDPARRNPFHLIAGEHTLTLVLGKGHLDEARNIVGEEYVEQTFTGLTEVGFQTEESVEETSCLHAIILNALTVRGIDWRFSVEGHHERFILLSNTDAEDAFRLVERLTASG